jgi:hypothetical protein
MSPAEDTRYTNYADGNLAVVFDGRYFMAYAIGREDVGVTITMEILAGIYPEIVGCAIKRLDSYNEDGSPFGIWMLEIVPPVDELDIEPHSWLNLQERCRRAMQLNHGPRDLIGTLERTVDHLDDLLDKSRQPSAWAEILLPVIEAANLEGISMDEILEAGYRKVQWIERENDKAKK